MTVVETEQSGLVFECRGCKSVLKFKDIQFLPFFLAPGDSLGDIKFLDTTTKTFFRGGIGVTNGQVACCPRCGVLNFSGFTAGHVDSLKPEVNQRKLIIPES